jgi:hypothetical protein
MSLIARMTPTFAHRFRVIACKAVLSGRAIKPREKGGEKHLQVQAFTHRFDKAIVARMVIHSREANHYPIGTGPVTHGRYAMYSRAIPGSRGWPREGRLQPCPLTVLVRSRLPARLAAPSSRAVFLESKFPNPAPATVCALGKESLTFTPLRRFIKIGQGNFQSFGHPH